MIEEMIKLEYGNGQFIALWKLYRHETTETTETAHSNSDKNIFLTHGTFSNKKVCMGITEYLVKEGYICWIMEWRNHGSSAPVKEKFNYESVALMEYPLVFNYLINELGINAVDCVLHSGGGLCLAMFLINNPKYNNNIKRTAMFGSQSFGAAHNFTNTLKIQLAKILNKIVGITPAKLVGSPHNETYYLMKQWYNWNLEENFIGNKGNDYRAEMDKIKTPILSICGSGDDFIAPIEGCKAFLDCFNNPKNKLLICGKETGFKEDYNHKRLIYSSNARKEIYPLVADWLAK